MKSMENKTTNLSKEAGLSKRTLPRMERSYGGQSKYDN